jgi:HSP20 family protein
MLAKLLPNPGIARPSATMPFQNLFREVEAWPRATEGWTTGKADIYETPDALVLKIDLPGHDPKSIDLQVENDLLTLRSRRAESLPEKATWVRRERFQGEEARTFVLPSTVDATQCDARYEHGVLTLSLPRKEEAKPRSIQVKVEG